MKERDKHKLFPYLMAVLAMVCWGMTFVWTKQVLQVFEPITVILIRLLISSLLLWIIIKLFGFYQPIKRGDIKLFLFSALFTPFLYFIGETYGLKYVSSTLGAVIITTIPVITPIGAYFFLKERLSWFNLVGLIISFSGVLLIIYSGEVEKGATVKGVLFLVFAVLVTVGYTITVKKLSHKYNSFTVVTIQNTIGVIYFLPLFFIMDFKGVVEADIPANIWWIILALAIFGSTLAFLFFTTAIRKLGATRTSVFTNLIPVFTAVFAWFLLAESITWMKVGGITIVIFGVLIVQVRKKIKKTI